ncbi:MAG: hypothetical protein ABL957_10180 [Parvularculaceae bacterium]
MPDVPSGPNPNDRSDNGSGYQSPGAGSTTSDDSGGFVAPSTEVLGVQSADQISEAFASEFGEDLLSLKAEIETKLCANATSASDDGGIQAIGGDNIVGVGLTALDAEDLAAGGGGLPGQPGLAVFTIERCTEDGLRAEISKSAGTRALSEAPIVQIPVGIVDAFSHRMRMRPAPGGISVAHFQVTAGTLGCLVIGNSAPRHQRLMVLSNNHVLANSNNAQLGACIAQQGPYDGGKCPADQIAILERFVPIKFGSGFNYVDCATGWAWPDRVRRELMYLAAGQPKYFRIGANPLAPVVGMLVGKTGRTTQLKQGRISAIGVTVNVNYGGGKVAQFRDQFSIRGLAGDFSAGGDSGSVIWQWASGLRPVGLLFAGGGGTTFGNPILRVLPALDARIFN